jgi:hypothetical protein
VRGEKVSQSASNRPQKRRKTPHFSEYENKVKKQNAFAQLLRWRTEYFSSLLDQRILAQAAMKIVAPLDQNVTPNPIPSPKPL